MIGPPTLLTPITHKGMKHDKHTEWDDPLRLRDHDMIKRINILATTKILVLNHQYMI